MSDRGCLFGILSQMTPVGAKSAGMELTFAWHSRWGFVFHRLRFIFHRRIVIESTQMMAIFAPVGR